MKRAAEVKRSPVAGDDGTMRGVGVVTNKKRPRKAADKPSKKKEKSSSEEKKKKKRSKKKKRRAEEKWTEKIASNSNKVEEPAAAAGDGDGAATPMLLSRELLEYLRTKEVMGLLATEAPLEPWASRMAAPLFDQTLKEEIAAEFQENREFDAHVLYQYRTCGDAYAEISSSQETELQAEKKQQLVVTEEMIRDELSYEVWRYATSIGMYTFENCLSLFEFDEIFLASRKHVENRANLLRRYRTNGHSSMLLQYQVDDDDSDRSC